MKILNQKTSESLQKLKAYEVNKLRKMEKEQKAFFLEIRELFDQSITNEKSKDDLLSTRQVTVEFGISRKTFDRWVESGLNILQRSSGSSIRVKRKDLETYLSEKDNVR